MSVIPQQSIQQQVVYRQAARAVARIMAPINASLDEGITRDVLFDGGEFSSGWHHERWNDEATRVIQYVAERFDISFEYLYAEIMFS